MRAAILAALLAGLAMPATHVAALAATGAGGDGLRALVFSRTTGFRHDSIPAGQALLQSLAQQHGFAVTLSEDPALFSTAGLAPFAAVVFLNTTGTVLDAGQKQAFETWVRGGGGFVGVHAAADTEYQWPFYGELLGGDAWFLSHPAIQDAQLDVETGDDRATRHLPARFGFRDEWYNFRANPRPAVTVLLRIDEASYAPGGFNHLNRVVGEYLKGRGRELRELVRPYGPNQGPADYFSMGMYAAVVCNDYPVAWQRSSPISQRRRELNRSIAAFPVHRDNRRSSCK